LAKKVHPGSSRNAGNDEKKPSIKEVSSEEEKTGFN
jgi:hypothetical protein